MNLTRSELVKLYNENIPVYSGLTKLVRKILDNAVEQENVKCALPIQARTKDILSFLEKVDRKKYTDPFAEMTDVTGLRIVLFCEDDVRFMCDVIHERFNVDLQRSVNKKEQLGKTQFGYSGINYVVTLPDDHPVVAEYPEFKKRPFEIQLLTLCQLVWSELQREIEYKSEDLVSTQVSRRLSMLCALFELADLEFAYLLEKGTEELLQQQTTLRSLRIYVKGSKKVNNLLLEGLKNGFVNRSSPEEDLDFLDELYEACTSLGLKTLSDLDIIFVNEDLVTHFYKSIRKHEANIRVGTITLALLLLYHSNTGINKQYLLDRHWKEDQVDFIVDRN